MKFLHSVPFCGLLPVYSGKIVEFYYPLMEASIARNHVSQHTIQNRITCILYHLIPFPSFKHRATYILEVVEADDVLPGGVAFGEEGVGLAQ